MSQSNATGQSQYETKRNVHPEIATRTHAHKLKFEYECFISVSLATSVSARTREWMVESKQTNCHRIVERFANRMNSIFQMKIENDGIFTLSVTIQRILNSAGERPQAQFAHASCRTCEMNGNDGNVSHLLNCCV